VRLVPGPDGFRVFALEENAADTGYSFKAGCLICFGCGDGFESIAKKKGYYKACRDQCLFCRDDRFL